MAQRECLALKFSMGCPFSPEPGRCSRQPYMTCINAPAFQGLYRLAVDLTLGLYCLFFFAKLTRRRLRHGVFRSVVDLQAAINRFIAEHNQTEAKRFT